MDYKEILEKRQTLYGEMQRFRKKLDDDSYNWSNEDETNWKSLQDDFNKFTRMKEREEELRDVENRMHQESEPAEDSSPVHYRSDSSYLASLKTKLTNDRTVSNEDRNQALRTWGGWGRNEVTESDLRACKRAGINPSQSFVDIPTVSNYNEFRSATLEHRADTSATTGGETIDSEFMREFERALLTFGGMRQSSRVIRTATGAALTWPTINDTAAAKHAALIDEAGALNEDDITTSSLTLNAYKYNSLVKITSELMQDSAFNMASELGSLLGERVGRGTNAHFTNGTGSGQPNGVVTACAGTTEITSGATAIDGDDLIDLFHSVDPAYRASPSCRFMMSDTYAGICRKLKDSTDQYIWQPGLQSGVPDVILGKPVTINQDMESGTPTTADNVILFGDFSKYIIREASSIRLVRLNELYMGNDQVGFTIFWRGDGDLLDAGTNPIYNLTLA